MFTMAKSVFLQEEGNTPKNRVWSFLIIHSEYDYSMKDIARYSKVGYTTLKELWKEFKEKKIVVQTRVVGKAKMYRLNIKNPVVNKFIDYYWAVVESVAEKDLGIKNESKIHEGGYKSVAPIAVSAKHS